MNEEYFYVIIDPKTGNGWGPFTDMDTAVRWSDIHLKEYTWLNYFPVEKIEGSNNEKRSYRELAGD